MLVVTLGLIAVLAMAAVALSGYLAIETRLMRYHVARAQARAWARAGVSLAMQRLAVDAQQPSEAYDWLGDDWAYFPQHAEDPTTWMVQLPIDGPGVSTDTGHVMIQIVDEERKLDLNHAPVEQLEHLLGSSEVAQAIRDYRDEDEVGDYESNPTTQPPYRTKNASIKVLEELWGIPRVGAEVGVKPLLAHHGTVALPQVAININTADVAVLRALFTSAGASSQPGLAEQVVDFRWDPGDGDVALGNRFTQLSGQVLAEGQGALNPGVQAALSNWMLGPLGSVLVVQSNHFTIVAQGQTTNPAVTYRIEAIVHRGGSGSAGVLHVSGQSFQILAWKES